ncbi:shikimate dehydrogenase [Microbacterium sp. NPDC078428]|uniref:shikimate dehydrogenase n=1 Tax=Microbacterium sp. NPDC078428 TaxID=3364190 RepID=UPI0037CC9954
MTVTGPRTRLAVWGSPIAHSRSPQLHLAAYAALGLDWRYERREVGAERFDESVASLDDAWRGLSLTMPLKEGAFRIAVERDRRAELTGAVNTLLLGPGGPRGVNTDVGGLVRALGDAGVPAVETARVIGAGATASSALVALSELGASRVDVLARRPDAARGLVVLGSRLGMDVRARPLGEDPATLADVVIGTLPGGAALAEKDADAALTDAPVLLDVAYSPWPSALAERQRLRGGAAVSGLGMLLHQALLQVRFFVNGDVDEPLAAEDDVLAAMRAALMGD